MKKTMVKVNDEEIQVLVTRKKSKQTCYKRLVTALFSRMYPNQIEKTIVREGKEPIIPFEFVLNQFQYNHRIQPPITNKCICGVKIKYNYGITNPQDGQLHIVGSTCCEMWRRINDFTERTKENKLKKVFDAFINEIKKRPKQIRFPADHPNYPNWRVARVGYKCMHQIRHELRYYIDNMIPEVDDFAIALNHAFYKQYDY
jgi:hypothetical protein